MILQHITEMPRLYSGRSNDGHEWTAIFLPRAFGEVLRTMGERQRVTTMRGIVADFRKSTGGRLGRSNYQEA